MVEFSKFMSSYSKVIGDTTKSAKYHDNALRIEDELHKKLLNPNNNMHCDYAGLQFEPKVDT